MVAGGDNQIIPELEGCLNCGTCCGMLLVTPERRRIIADYLSVSPEAKDFALTRMFNTEKCVFRDDTIKRCRIYPVRPYVCRVFGVVNHFGFGVCSFVKAEKMVKYDPPMEDRSTDNRLINEIFGNPKYAEMYRSLNEWMKENLTTQGFLIVTLMRKIDSIILAHGDKSLQEISECLADYFEALNKNELLTLVEYARGKLDIGL